MSSSSVLPLLLKHGFKPKTQALKVNYRSLHPAQKRIRAEMRRFNVASLGRRFGKTFMCVDWCIEPAVEKGLPVAWFAPTAKMWQEVWNDIISVIGRENIQRSNFQMGRIELKNGGKIDFWSLEAAPTLRGRKYARIVIDEAAHVPDLQTAWEKVIAPTLTDYKGQAFFISTPNGYNFFRTLYEFGEDPLKPDWMCWKKPTTDNPHIDPAEVEMWREMMSEDSFQQEYLAEFLRDQGKVFRNVIENLTSPADQTPEMHKGHRLISGVDWAQVQDFTCHSVACDTCRCEVSLDRFNKIEFAYQRSRIMRQLLEWNVAECNVEENSIGRPNYEELIREIQKWNQENPDRQIKTQINAVRMTAESKPQMVESLKLSLEKEQFRFLADEAAKNELLTYEAKVNPKTGRISYSAPKGAHDDTVVARMMMLRAAHTPGSFRIVDFRLR